MKRTTGWLRPAAVGLLGGIGLLAWATAGATPAPPGSVRLNHLYVTVDSGTYRAVIGSAFIRDELSHFVSRTTETGDGRTWAGAYFLGRHTYLEMFAESPDRALGSTGLALGAESPREFREWERMLRARTDLELEARVETRLRSDGVSVPWFHTLEVPDEAVSGADRRLTVWTMAYHEQYATQWGMTEVGAADSLSREAYLAQAFEPDRLLEDVVGVTLALGPDDRHFLSAYLAALDAPLLPSEDGASETARGEDIRFRVVAPEPHRPVVREIDFRLTRAVPASTVELGAGSRIELKRRTARWIFDG